MLHSGLVSITFRKLPPEELVALVAKAGLEGVEWGGDVHVPHGDLRRAREVRKITLDAGLKVASYGSYYRVGHDEPVPFEVVLATAAELAAPTIRLWAGKQGSETADAEYRDRVVQESQRIAELAAQANIVPAYEFHSGTLTDTNASARELLAAVAHDNMKTYWQPPVGASVTYCLEGLEALLPWLSNIHAFHWVSGKRLPLAEGEHAWKRYLQTIGPTGREHFVLLEFVKDGSQEIFLNDAAALAEWLQRQNQNTGK